MMTVTHLLNQLQSDLATCGDSQVIIELKDPTGQIIRATFLADRYVVKHDGKNEYVLKMGWPHP
jgi:hypothetical protein